MVKAGCVSPPDGFLVEREGVEKRVERARRREEGLRRATVEAHKLFWDKNVPEGKWDHWRFEVRAFSLFYFFFSLFLFLWGVCSGSCLLTFLNFGPPLPSL